MVWRATLLQIVSLPQVVRHIDPHRHLLHITIQRQRSNVLDHIQHHDHDLAADSSRDHAVVHVTGVGDQVILHRIVMPKHILMVRNYDDPINVIHQAGPTIMMTMMMMMIATDPTRIRVESAMLITFEHTCFIVTNSHRCGTV